MQKTSWDPLLFSKDADEEIVSAARKREIQNILKSYVGMYDSFSELIQNSMDAVDRRAESEGPDFKGKLWLTIDLLENSFSITDNGIGFNEKEFESFLAPSISFKDGKNTRGKKGVGATYIGYGFDYLLFGTKGNEHEFVGEITGGRNWVEDSNGIITRPVVSPATANNEDFDGISQGSTFKIKFGGEHTRPKDLSWYTATNAEQWLYLLLIKTPLGAISYLNEASEHISFNLKVIDKQSNVSTLNDQNASYIYPHKKINASVNLKDVQETQKKLLEKGKDASDIPTKYKKANGIYETFSTDEIINLRPSDEEYRELVKYYQVEAYGYFTYSTSVWDQFNDNLAKLRKGYRVLKGG